MKILFITQVFPYPPDSGGRIKTYETLKLLGKKHEVYLVCFSPKLLSREQEEKILKICRSIKVITSLIPFSQFKDIKPFIFRHLFSPMPFIVNRFRNKKMEQIIKSLIKKEHFDAIHIDHINMAWVLSLKKECLWVLEEHNLESEIAWGIFRKEKWNKFKFFSLIEALKLNLFEKKMFSKFDWILAISPEDKNKMVKMVINEEKILFLPTAFKVKNLFKFKSLQKSPVILFVGMLSWWPNKDGFWWFYEKVFPLIKEAVAGVKLVVVGKEADEKIIETGRNDKQLEIIGYAKDIDPYFESANVFIAPLRSGSGIRIKILTALSRGLPVVSTKKGAEGIIQKSGPDLILADKPNDFAKAVIKLMKSKKMALKLSKEGIDFIRKDYNSQKAQKVLEKIYG